VVEELPTVVLVEDPAGKVVDVDEVVGPPLAVVDVGFTDVVVAPRVVVGEVCAVTAVAIKPTETTQSARNETELRVRRN
jgi:hypothetical protein